MKENRIERGQSRGRMALIALVALTALGVGLKFGYDALRDAYLEQCVIRDLAAQVEITSGKMVHPSTIAEEFGLKAGKNLATIDFTKKRDEVLAKIPNLRAIHISRYLPSKVVIDAEERVPIAKMGIRGQKGVTGRVVDTEGVVFICQRGTQTLPTIVETQTPGTRPGQHVTNRTRAALRLIEACHEPEYLELGILEVDTAKHDFLVVTLGNYSRVKIRWEDMDGESPQSRTDLVKRLSLLRQAIRTKTTPETVIWNVTIPGRVFADTQGKI